MEKKGTSEALSVLKVRVVQIKVPGPKERDDEDGWESFLSVLKYSMSASLDPLTV